MSLKFAIVVPCYNEKETLPSTVQTLSEYLEKLIAEGKSDEGSFLYLVDDGSHDETWSLIRSFHEAKPGRVKGLKLAANVGHQKALLAGLHRVRHRVDCAISIDADLQDDFRAIESMLEAHRRGAEVVFGVRQKRQTDTHFKRWTAQGFYKIMRALHVRIVENHADFRLLGPQALRCLSAYRESNLFLRGIVPLMGFPTEEVRYDRKPREAGESKYPLRKMLSFAWDGITSFSPAPLRLISLTGICMFILSIIAAVYFLYMHFAGHTIVGWTSVAIALYMLGGIQLLAIGVLGEYLAKIYLETKQRPRYFVERELK